MFFVGKNKFARLISDKILWFFLEKVTRSFNNTEKEEGKNYEAYTLIVLFHSSCSFLFKLYTAFIFIYLLVCSSSEPVTLNSLFWSKHNEIDIQLDFTVHLSYSRALVILLYICRSLVHHTYKTFVVHFIHNKRFFL